MTDVQTRLIEMGKAMGIKISQEQGEKFQAYMELLLDWNERVNLTAITEPDEILEKHFLDSLTVLLACEPKSGAKVLDVGTGAGFPGVPMKILRPDLQLTLMDGANKRLRFLSELCKRLKFDCICLHKRAEEAGLNPLMRESFDLVTARAVAGLSVLSEYCIPLVKMKGWFVAMKGPGAAEELEEARGAIRILGGDKEKIVSFQLPTAGERKLVVVRKLHFTPKGYPRHGGTIVKHPLSGI